MCVGPLKQVENAVSRILARHTKQRHTETGDCVKQEEKLAARQLWFKFEEESRPVPVTLGMEKEAEESEKELGGSGWSIRSIWSRRIERSPGRK